mgnify:FL=1
MATGYQRPKNDNQENLVNNGNTGWLVKQGSDIDDDDTEATSVLRDEDDMTLKDVSTLGFQQSEKFEDIFLHDLQFDFENDNLENLVKDGSKASLVNLDSDIDDDDHNKAGSVLGDEDNVTLQDEFTGTVHKRRKQHKKNIKINRDTVKFISKRKKYSQELTDKLEMLSAEVELVPEKSLIVVTKKLCSEPIQNWNKQCVLIVTTFGSRFKKNRFELNDSTSVRNALPKLRKMLQWSNSAFWIESNKRLAVMTEQSECEQVLKNVREFLGNDGTEQHRTGKGELKKPLKYDATKNIVAFNSFDKDAHVSKVPGEKRQWKKIVNIDNDIANFLLKNPKYSEELKGLLSRHGAELQILKSGCIKIKVGGNTITNWEERCEKTINVFCGCFDKKDFPLDDEIRDSIPEALSTLQKDLSSTEGACWLDKHKQNLILVSPKDGFSNAEKEVKQFFEKVRRFAKRNFEIEESIYELVRKDLPTLKEALKQCNITLNKKTMVVVCLRNEVDNVTEQVESFLQRLQGVKLDDYLHPKELTSKRVKTKKLTSVTVRINQDVTKFVMNDEGFIQELADQLEKLNAEIKWIPGNSSVSIIQKSEDVVLPKWSEKCKGAVMTFFQRFHKEYFSIQTDLQDSAGNTLHVFKESISCFKADCWLTSSNRGLVLVVLKDNLSSVVKLVEDFLQNLREEKEKQKEIVKFVQISSDHVDFIERTQFVNTLKQCHPGMVEVSITQAKNEICFMGSDEAILVAEQQYADLVKELTFIELQLPTEVMQLVSQKEGLEFISNSLSNRGGVYVIMVGTGGVKIVARSPQVCEEVRECLCKNVRKATIALPPESEHIFASKQWYEVSKTIERESLVNYQINFVQEIRHGIELHGATHLVENYKEKITDFINAQKIESCEMRLPSGIARFMKEKLGDEIAKIESDLRDEQVKINILLEKRTCECKGTKEGIRESKRRVLALSNEITPKSKDCSKIGICTLFFGENGQRNIKGIETATNTIIKLSKVPSTVEKESTQAEIEAIRAERAQGKSKVRQENLKDPFDQCNFTTNEGLQVSWKYGNIAQERADILVSSAVRNLRNPTMVGRVMNSVGGPSFVAACCQHTNIGTGDIATTIGGNLLCQYVIHAVCCEWSRNGVAEQTLRELLLKILLECTRLSASSVAMPLIGTGKHKFPEDFVLRVMREEFVKFSSMYSSRTLKEIKLLRYDLSGGRTTVQASPVSASTYKMAPGINQSTTAFVPLVAGSTTEAVKLQVFARSSTDISSAHDEIEKFIRNHLISKTLNHEKHYDVVLKHWDELKRLTKDRDLKITCLDPTTVLMEGVLSKVVEAKDKLNELVSQYTNEERTTNQLSYISQNVQWYYCDLMSSREVPYSTQLNGTIELARMNGEATVEIIEPDGQKYVVDFSEMIAKNTSSGSYLPNFVAGWQYARSGQTKKLTRKFIGSAANPGSELCLPSNWTPQPENQLVQMVQIAILSQEYMEVRNHFVARGGNASQLYKVERIQNPQLYSRYLAFKKSMRGQVNEMRLFHGTDAANVDSINAHNFSRSFAGVNGVAYGHGVYFARDASYSMSYASRQLSGSLPKMYMAKVLVGEYTSGAKGMKAPPLKNDPNNPGLRYDSVVDHPSNPSMYIIFQDNQYYPEYLLTMRVP